MRFHAARSCLLLSATALSMFYVADASAVNVSNLDKEPHYVIFEETHGSKHIRRVNPGETIRSVAGGGAVMLRDKPQTRLMIEELDRLAIWPGGNLQIQMRRKRSGGE